MCCSQPKAPKADPNIGAAQKELADLAVRQQNWYETNLAPKVLDQLDQSLAISKRTSDSQLDMADFQRGLMTKYDDRYWGTQVPLEDELIAKARSYNETAEQEKMAMQAGADVEQASAVARSQMGRGLRSMGVNPGSAAAISAYGDMYTQSALAKAGAVNKTREAARQLGWTRMGEAAALGRGLPGFGATSAGLSMNASGGANAAAGAGMGAIGSAGGINAGNTAAVGGLWGNVGSLGVQKYNADISNYGVQAQNDPFNTILGAASAIGTQWALGKVGP